MTSSPVTVRLITMGCSKNLVDSQRVSAMLAEKGFAVVTDEYNDTADTDSADTSRQVVVINTCGFIGDAKEESIDMILQATAMKDAGKVDAVIVMGCLSQRYRKELPTEIGEVDAWYGKFDWVTLADDLREKYRGAVSAPVPTPATKNHYAYIKISEGCNRFCAFCAIPLITGRHKSRSIDDILSEVEKLVGEGVHEFNVIAQDLSAYGTDLPGRRSRLAELIERMASIRGVAAIRLHYAYPSDFPYDILPVMACHDNVCRYIDIALQHISDNVLSRMRRHITAAETRELLARIRREVPGIHIRTTLMVGFPGETDADFDELLDFVREQRFERMGAFAYSEEEDTYAQRNYADDVSPEIKQQRLDTLMAVQEEIALESNQSKIGRTMRVVVDSENDDYYVCRSEFDSPEVDPEVLVAKTVKLRAGDYIDVEITAAEPYELMGRVAAK